MEVWQMKDTEKQEWLRQAGEEGEKWSAEEVLGWAVKQFPRITFACSFGAEDVVVVNMLQSIRPETGIFYLDTDFHFKETYETRDRLEQRHGIRFAQIRPDLTPEEQAWQYGDKLWQRDPNLCCRIRKIEPLRKWLKNYDAWITGIRREQSPTRREARKIEYDHKFSLVKINPLADWTSADVWKYIREHNVIYNPLHDQNYPSIGCSHCTLPVKEGEDPRAGRWSGFDKLECGLHK
jgi:phosphoadenosine phosphosulfate reductase